jgi:hypothetical protein
MCAEASATLVAVAADFFFDGSNLIFYCYVTRYPRNANSGHSSDGRDAEILLYPKYKINFS